MALTFPLSLETFFDLLPIKQMSLAPSASMAISRTRGGDVLPAGFGARLWRGEIRLDVMTDAEHRAVRPLLDLLIEPGASFLLTDRLRSAPRDDPKGLILGAANPQLLTVGAREIALKGLPSQYWLRRDDLISFSYGASPVRRALHRLVGEVKADGSGNTAAVEVMPPVRAGAAANTPVTLIRPVCKAMILPETLERGYPGAGGVTEGISFRFQQTLR